MKTIQLDKKYRYRNGEPARILCIDAPGDEPVKSLDLRGESFGHKAEGVYYKSGDKSDWDLIEILSLDVVDNRVLLTDEVRTALMDAGFELGETCNHSGPRKYQKGDTVKVIRRIDERNQVFSWTSEMDSFLNVDSEVKLDQDGRGAILLSIPERKSLGSWFFPSDHIELVTPAKP